MPFINIAVAQGRLSKTKKQRLFEKTTHLMAEVMHKDPSLTAIRINEYAAENWAIAGEAVSTGDRAAVHMDTKVTAGTNTNAEKAEMISRSMEMLTEIVGPVPEASYVVIHDLDAGAWGYNGRTQKARADAKADAKAA